MDLSKGTQSSYPNQVCKVLKSLYGLKQSNRKWFTKLSSVLLSNNFSQCVVDHSLFSHKSKTSFTALLIYVDDIMIAGNNLENHSTYQKHIATSFSYQEPWKFEVLTWARSSKKQIRDQYQ